MRKALRRCPTCEGGPLVLTTGTGRRLSLRSYSLSVPDSLAVPTCAACGAVAVTSRELDAPLRAQYDAELIERLQRALARLKACNVSMRSLEDLCELSSGYLCRLGGGKRRTSRALVALLELLANDPETRVNELRRSFGVPALYRHSSRTPGR